MTPYQQLEMVNLTDNEKEALTFQSMAEVLAYQEKVKAANG